MARTISARILKLSVALLLLPGFSACSDEQGEDSVQDPITGSSSAEEILERILAHCHGPRRGQLGNSSIEMTDAAGRGELLSYSAPDKLRISQAEGRQALVRGGEAWIWEQNEEAKPAEENELTDLIRLRDLIGMMFLQPLYSPQGWEKAAADVLIKRPGEGEEWRLEFDGRTSEPVSLQGPSGRVQFLETTRGRTRIPTRVAFDPLGEYRVKVVSAGQNFRADLFQIPSQRTRGGAQIVLGRSSKPETPEFQENRGRQLLLVEDPGDWESRRKTCNNLGRALAAAEQSNAGDPFFMQEEGQARMAIPFKPGRGNEGEEFEAGEGMEVRTMTTETIAVVYAPEAEFSERLELGEKMLEEFLTENGVTAAGPLRMVINFFSSQDPRQPEARKRMSLRLEIPVQR
ncbi:MAG: hypothetical protein ACYTG5_11320 [Planctomycetota bacterium]